MRYRLIIFDFDGTLADSAEWFFRAWNEIAPRFGCRTVDEAEIEQLRGCSNRKIVRALDVPAWRLPAIARHMRAKVAREAASIGLFPGVDVLIERLAGAGLTLAIVSSNSEANVRTILGPANAGRITLYECGASLFGKAARFRRAVKRLGIPASQALAVGDETRDVEAAQAAGIASAVVLWGYASEPAFAGLTPTFMFRRIDELAESLIA